LRHVKRRFLVNAIFDGSHGITMLHVR
jgi:hypothetical protein